MTVCPGADNGRSSRGDCKQTGARRGERKAEMAKEDFNFRLYGWHKGPQGKGYVLKNKPDRGVC